MVMKVKMQLVLLKIFFAIMVGIIAYLGMKY